MNGAGKMDYIIINNASENNLKNITVEIPLNRFTCVTGPSGCGKSSLVFDTLYAESQRNFLESMTGNMFGQKIMDKPKVDTIENLRPALNISQTYYNVNPRSTVGTVTDISYYLRTLFAFIENQRSDSHYEMNYFSPNNPLSCCPCCKGLGEEYVISKEAVIPDVEKTLDAGGISYFKGSRTSKEYKLLEEICRLYGIDINKKVKELTDLEMYNLLYREKAHTFHVKFKTNKGRYKEWKVTEQGVMVELQRQLKNIDCPSVFSNIEKYLVKQKCSVCNGQKLKRSILDIKVCGLNIGEVEQLSILQLSIWCGKVQDDFAHCSYFMPIMLTISTIQRKLRNLINLKLDYISICRGIPTLSGGELQRVRIATQLDCNLSGLIYILDEPCKGLHYSDIVAIINATRSLVNKGNTVISIEHNKQYISASDNVIQMGPVGGPKGGYIISECGRELSNLNEVKEKKARITDQYLQLNGIYYHNLRNINVKIPIGCVTCISGVSGSGKSSLADIIELCCSKGENEFCRKISGRENIQKVMRVNQQPIGKTARSIVASYLGIYDNIRRIFSSADAAKKKKLSTSSFSMNVVGGRCECCQGTGKKKIDLSYLPTSYIICPECKGNRFHQDVLSVKYQGYSINDILNENVHNLLPVFEDNNTIYGCLKCLDDIGMGYISLGQMSMNLSGGEAQRIKLAKYLGLNLKKNSLYILDEPTSGLSELEANLLIDVINQTVEHGATIVIIEHNIEFMLRVSDYMIDLGKQAGNQRKQFVAEGSANKVIHTVGSSWNGVPIT